MWSRRDKKTEGDSNPETKPTREQRDWTQGNILSNLWGLSWPMMISGLVEQLGPTVDMIWMGKLGQAAVAGVGIAGLAVMTVNAARMGINTGIRAMIARAVGAKNPEEANRVAQQGLVISTIFAILMAIIGGFFSDSILQLLGASPAVVQTGAAYMRIQLVGSIFMSLGMLANGIMQASGDTVTPMKLIIAGRLLHVVLSPCLIFGLWIFPRLEVRGAAMSNIVQYALIGAGIGLWILFSGRSRSSLKPTMKGFRFDGKLIWRMVKISIPSSFTGMERNFASLVIVKFMSPFGTVAVAAHALLQRIDPFLHMPAQGFGQAAGVLAGQNLGAKQPAQAERAGWIATFIYTGVMVFSSLLVLLIPGPIIRIFNSDTDLVNLTTAFLRIEIINYMALGFATVLSNCLNGCGDTWVPMWNNLISMWAINVPLSWYLSTQTSLGVYGVRWAGAIAIVMRAIVYVTYWKIGRWKTKRV
jgi:putative MATE family efflux protein